MADDSQPALLPPGDEAEGGALVYDAPAPRYPTRMVGQKERALIAVQRMHHRIRKKSTRILNYALSGAEIDDDSPKPADWSETKYRVARDARKSLKERPIYIQLAAEQHKTYVQADAQKDAAPSLNANVVNVYVDRRTYEVKEVKE